MTLIEKRRPDEGSAGGGRGGPVSTGASRAGWMIFAAVMVVAVAGSIYVGHSGLSASSRGNPAGHLAREDPLFGIVNWPAIFSVTFVVVTVGMGIAFARISLRQRGMHHLLIVFLCVLSMSLLDPPANWVTYTVFDPQFLHYPTSWHWMSLAPLIEPIVNPPGYPMYFLTVALCSAWVAKKVLARSRPGSWAPAHPRLTYLLAGGAVGFVWDIATELFMIRAHMYFYSEAWGPTLGAGHGRLPIVWGFYTWFAIGTVTVLLHRDDRGRSLAHSLAEKLPGRGSASSGRVVMAGSLFLCGLYLIPTALYGAIRVAGLDHPNTPTGWQYPESKVYDPYGELHDAGLPGPYYK